MKKTNDQTFIKLTGEKGLYLSFKSFQERYPCVLFKIYVYILNKFKNSGNQKIVRKISSSQNY